MLAVALAEESEMTVTAHRRVTAGELKGCARLRRVTLE
jgi:hypothetical protein